MEKTHHFAAALYFGIASLEAFLNKQMRSHLAKDRNEAEIYDVLRKARFLTKLKDWPERISGKPLILDNPVSELLLLAHEVRGDLTHPKSHGLDIYERLHSLKPMAVVHSVAEYIARFCENRDIVYPYWIFGWNYLNRRAESYEIILLNDQQFCHSLTALGWRFNAWDAALAEAWKKPNLGTVAGYAKIRDALGGATSCEPKNARFPFQPKLCRLWWTNEHHATCGHASLESKGFSE
jgi:hypothetical protein